MSLTPIKTKDETFWNAASWRIFNPENTNIFYWSQFILFMFQVVSPEDAYKVHRKLEEAAIIVMGVKEPHITVTITLTSPIMREQLLTLEGSGGKETKRVLIGIAGIIEIANQGPIARWCGMKACNVCAYGPLVLPRY
jgi:hypothetical protein